MDSALRLASPRTSRLPILSVIALL
jgi:hypothetical protein